MRIEPFDPALHERREFRCGHPALDDYLRRYASQGQRHHLVRIYVALDDADRVLGHYSLSAASLSHAELPEADARRLPRYPVPAVLIGRLASDTGARQSGLRIGSRLLVHALRQALRAAETIGVQCVIVDSKPDSADFYRRFGFVPLQREGLKLYLPIATIKKLDARDDLDGQ
ncbi:GNAT family N-acetyltransferase [Imhoffiella purpurea]|uniref:Acetyltransferase n=1 Tax=Imhoffiella purpurea TaxID=1249627 RepID=W9VZR3_9GAMM|nr:acetyltransferase [Imhoffiella purpurea]EXJ15835.1 Acetyltransferase [Imhoffiella purpurea]